MQPPLPPSKPLPPLNAPRGFKEIAHEPGMTLWKRMGDYVQHVSLNEGAQLHLLHGKVIPSDGAGTNFARKNLQTWWKDRNHP